MATRTYPLPLLQTLKMDHDMRYRFSPHALCSRVLLLALALATGVFAIGCDSGPKIASNAVRIGPAENNGRVTLQPGQMLVIQLDRNPSTGYTWQLISEVNQAVIMRDGTKGYQTSQQQSVHDNIEEQLLRFVAQEPGETNIRLNYVQPEFGPTGQTATYTVHVIVK